MAHKSPHHNSHSENPLNQRFGDFHDLTVYVCYTDAKKSCLLVSTIKILNILKNYINFSRYTFIVKSLPQKGQKYLAS